MKQFIFTGVLVLAGVVAGEAMAACTAGGGWTQVTALVSTLTNSSTALGMTACSAAGQGTQEEHHYASGTGGDLWDYKCGAPDAAVPATACANPATDPRRLLGTWSVTGDTTATAAVTYSYTAFGSATAGPFNVFTDGTNYDFCTAAPASVGTFTLIPTTGTTRVCPGPF